MQGLQQYRNSTSIGIGDTGISLPTPIPIRDIADLTILKEDNYYAFAMAEEPLSPYSEVTELHDFYVNVCIILVLCLYYYTLRSMRSTVYTK